ncbi:MAG: phosphate signaling complex protein PhoU [Planctomycetota bacterium]|jgi:phosphate transport system protein
MTRHIQRDLEKLKKLILTMGGLVEQSLQQGTRGLVEWDEQSAKAAIEGDREIDRLQLEIDEECLKALALHQPVAGDLRFITSTMKICNDLERIGDLARNLGERVLTVLEQNVRTEPLQFAKMVEVTRGMLRDSLDAMVNEDSKLAREVCLRDDEVDKINSEHFKVLQDRMRQDPETVIAAVAMLSATRNIERIADLATNIAEDVVFLVEAQDIRHPSLKD